MVQTTTKFESTPTLEVNSWWFWWHSVACKGGKEVKILEEFSSHFYRSGFCEECEAEVEAAYVGMTFDVFRNEMAFSRKNWSKRQNPSFRSQQISLEPITRQLIAKKERRNFSTLEKRYKIWIFSGGISKRCYTLYSLIADSCAIQIKTEGWDSSSMIFSRQHQAFFIFRFKSTALLWPD